MGSEKIIFTIVIALSFLSLFMGGIVNMRIQAQTYNVTSSNFTFIGGNSPTLIPPPPKLQTNNNWISQMVDTTIYAWNYVQWLITIVTTDNDIRWLAIIMIGLAGVLLYIVIKIVSGILPTVGGVS